MKREDPARQPEPATEDPEVATSDEAAVDGGASETYLADGDVPAVATEPTVEAAAPTASEQAFSPEETPAQADQKAIKAATEYNDDRPHNVAEFNQLTESSCVKNGALDIEKVRDFQKAAHLDADGRIGPWTLAAAKRSSEIREKTTASDAEQSAKLKPKKVEQVPAQEAVVAAPIIAAPVAAKVDAPKETVAGEPALAKSDQKHQAAIEFNERHAALVSEFNQVTEFACTEGGNLDIEKVMEFQLAHGCKADGRIDALTLAAAKQTAEPMTHAQLEAAPPVEVVREHA
jgi:murein L,D-transpeptidase YcbB/YkuD